MSWRGRLFVFSFPGFIKIVNTSFCDMSSLRQVAEVAEDTVPMYCSSKNKKMSSNGDNINDDEDDDGVSAWGLSGKLLQDAYDYQINYFVSSGVYTTQNGGVISIETESS
jgi:hypothetical protein